MKNGIIKTQNKGKRARLKKTIPINKNQLYFYTLTMKNLKIKLRKQFPLQFQEQE